jgi:hypothetical protein
VFHHHIGSYTTNVNRFLWATLQISALCHQGSDAAIRASLASLPKGLPETYQQILSRIGSEPRAETVRKIFRWVAVAKRPMHLEELREAIAVKPEDRFLQKDRLVNRIDLLVSWCGDLVTLDEDELLIQFAHYTIKDFLVSPRLEESDFHFSLDEADHAVGKMCVAYLNFDDFERQMIKTSQTHLVLEPKDLVEATAAASGTTIFKYGARLTSRLRKRKSDFDAMKHLSNIRTGKGASFLSTLHTEYRLLAYASEHWIKHTTRFARRTVNPDDRHSLLWEELIMTRHPLAAPSWNTEDRKANATIVQNLILDHNFSALIDFLDSDLEVEDESIASVLRNDVDLFDLTLEASKRGLTAIVTALSRYRHLLGYERATLRLYVAADEGNIQEMETLFKMGANAMVQSTMWKHFTPLYLAARRGHLMAVNRLLVAGAEVNDMAVDEEEFSLYGELKVRAAMILGDLNSVGIFLRRYGEFPVVSEEYGSLALELAAAYGRREIAKEFLNLGVDTKIDLPDSGEFKALDIARIKGHAKVVKLLEEFRDRVRSANHELEKSNRRKYSYYSEHASVFADKIRNSLPFAKQKSN